MDDCYEWAESAATEAEAVYRCPNHDDIVLTHADDEADRRAFAIATNLLKRGKIKCDRRQLLDAVQDVLGSAAFECPYDGCSGT